MSLEHSPTRHRREMGGAHEPPHLSRTELAERLHLDPVTITRCWRKWGLKPIRLSGRLLFPDDQVRELERRAMSGEFVAK